MVRNSRYLRSAVFEYCISFTAIIGIVIASTRSSFREQILYFTTQSNLLISLTLFVKATLNITNYFKNKNYVIPDELYLGMVYFVTITGLVYCFIFVPGGLTVIRNKTFIQYFKLHSFLLHVVVPVLSFIDYYLFNSKGNIKFKHICLWLIYPILYAVFTYTRPLVSDFAFSNGEMYPYLIMNPNWKGYFLSLTITIVGLSMFFILGYCFYKLDKYLRNK